MAQTHLDLTSSGSRCLFFETLEVPYAPSLCLVVVCRPLLVSIIVVSDKALRNDYFSVLDKGVSKVGLAHWALLVYLNISNAKSHTTTIVRHNGRIKSLISRITSIFAKNTS